MLKKFNLVIILTIIATIAGNTQAAQKIKSTNNHRFYLLSAYTPENNQIDKEKFTNSYQSIAKRGVIVYRNGQTYNILVPVKSIYRKNSANYTSNGEQILKDLSRFLAFYDTEFMTFTGIGFEEAREEAQKHAETGLKTSYHPSKKICTDLSKQPRKVKPILVSLKQTSQMVKAMRKMHGKMTNVGISIADEVDRNNIFMKGMSDKVNMKMSSANSRLQTVSMILEEVVSGSEDLGIFNDGAVMIEFKKY